MQFIKTRPVQDPERVITNAGIDCFVPYYNNDFVKDLAAKSPNLVVCQTSTEAFEAALARKTFMFGEDIYIAPGEDIIIPSGIRSKFGPELALIANNKSGIATKRKLIFGASVIDSNYQGEWHFNMHNISNNYQKISCNDKIIQFIPHKISTDPVEVLDLSIDKFYTEKTERGEGWAGSTNKETN